MLRIDLSVFWVVGLLLVLTVILDRLVFRPVLKVIKQRDDAALAARTLAEQASEEARRAGEEFDKKTQLARAAVYRQMDEMRRDALADRTALIEDTRKEADHALAQARADLARDVDAARTRLSQDAEALATDAATRILGRQPS